VAKRTLTPAGGAPEPPAQCANNADNDGDAIADDGCLVHLLADHLGGTVEALTSVT
jgi:hypothetical protein